MPRDKAKKIIEDEELPAQFRKIEKLPGETGNGTSTKGRHHFQSGFAKTVGFLKHKSPVRRFYMCSINLFYKNTIIVPTTKEIFSFNIMN